MSVRNIKGPPPKRGAFYVYDFKVLLGEVVPLSRLAVSQRHRKGVPAASVNTRRDADRQQCSVVLDYDRACTRCCRRDARLTVEALTRKGNGHRCTSHSRAVNHTKAQARRGRRYCTSAHRSRRDGRRTISIDSSYRNGVRRGRRQTGDCARRRSCGNRSTGNSCVTGRRSDVVTSDRGSARV